MLMGLVTAAVLAHGDMVKSLALAGVLPRTGPAMMEETLRRVLLISRGDPMVFIERPISLGFIVATVLILIVMAAPAMRSKREQITDTA